MIDDCRLLIEEVAMAEGKSNEILVALESGHYKNVKGTWKGDSVWMHIFKEGGGMIHVNKDKVEYIETFESKKPK